MAPIHPEPLTGVQWAEALQAGLGESTTSGTLDGIEVAGLAFDADLARRAPLVDERVAALLVAPPSGVAALIRRAPRTLVFHTSGLPLDLAIGEQAPRAAMQLVAAVCGALERATAAGLGPHGALAPHRIRVDPDGVTLLGHGVPPLGVFAWVDGVWADAPGAALAWSPPERLEAFEEEPRSDLWALAALAASVALGGPVWQGPASAVAEAIKAGRTPSRIESLQRGLPDAVLDLLCVGTERAPSDRFRNAGEMRRDAERALQGLTGPGLSDRRVPRAIPSPSAPPEVAAPTVDRVAPIRERARALQAQVARWTEAARAARAEADTSAGLDADTAAGWQRPIHQGADRAERAARQVEVAVGILTVDEDPDDAALSLELVVANARDAEAGHTAVVEALEGLRAAVGAAERARRADREREEALEATRGRAEAAAARAARAAADHAEGAERSWPADPEIARLAAEARRAAEAIAGRSGADPSRAAARAAEAEQAADAATARCDAARAAGASEINEARRACAEIVVEIERLASVEPIPETAALHQRLSARRDAARSALEAAASDAAPRRAWGAVRPVLERERAAQRSEAAAHAEELERARIRAEADAARQATVNRQRAEAEAALASLEQALGAPLHLDPDPPPEAIEATREAAEALDEARGLTTDARLAARALPADRNGAAAAAVMGFTGRARARLADAADAARRAASARATWEARQRDAAAQRERLSAAVGRAHADLERARALVREATEALDEAGDLERTRVVEARALRGRAVEAIEVAEFQLDQATETFRLVQAQSDPDEAAAYAATVHGLAERIRLDLPEPLEGLARACALHRAAAEAVATHRARVVGARAQVAAAFEALEPDRQAAVREAEAWPDAEVARHARDAATPVTDSGALDPCVMEAERADTPEAAAAIADRAERVAGQELARVAAAREAVANARAALAAHANTVRRRNDARTRLEAAWSRAAASDAELRVEREALDRLFADVSASEGPTLAAAREAAASGRAVAEATQRLRDALDRFDKTVDVARAESLTAEAVGFADTHALLVEATRDALALARDRASGEPARREANRRARVDAARGAARDAVATLPAVLAALGWPDAAPSARVAPWVANAERALAAARAAQGLAEEAAARADTEDPDDAERAARVARDEADAALAHAERAREALEAAARARAAEDAQDRAAAAARAALETAAARVAAALDRVHRLRDPHETEGLDEAARGAVRAALDALDRQASVVRQTIALGGDDEAVPLETLAKKARAAASKVDDEAHRAEQAAEEGTRVAASRLEQIWLGHRRAWADAEARRAALRDEAAAAADHPAAAERDVFRATCGAPLTPPPPLTGSIVERAVATAAAEAARAAAEGQRDAAEQARVRWQAAVRADEERKKAEAAIARKAAQEARRLAEEAERAEQEARRKAEEQARQRAEEDARREAAAHQAAERARRDEEARLAAAADEARADAKRRDDQIAEAVAAAEDAAAIAQRAQSLATTFADAVAALPDPSGEGGRVAEALHGAARNAHSAARRARRAADAAAADPATASDRAREALHRATEALGVLVKEKRVGLQVLARLEQAPGRASPPDPAGRDDADRAARDDERQKRLRDALEKRRAAATAPPSTSTVGPGTPRWGAVSRAARDDES